MEEKLQERIVEITNSMRDSQRARPSNDLFERIEAKIYNQTGKEISLKHLRYAAAAAILMLLLNVVSLKTYLDVQETNTAAETYADYNSPGLTLDYNLYNQ